MSWLSRIDTTIVDGLIVVTTPTVAAIQAALDAAPLGSEFRLVNQTYVGLDALAVPEYTTMIGSSGTRLLFTAGGAGSGLLTLTGAHIRLKEFWISGNEAVRPAIYATALKQSSFEDLVATGAKDGIYATGTSWMNSFENCRFQNMSEYGFMFASGGSVTSTTLKKCYTDQCINSGFSFNGGNYNYMIGCAADNHGDYGYYIANTGLTMIGCGAEEIDKSAIRHYNLAKLNIINFTAVNCCIDNPASHGTALYATGGGLLSVDGFFEHSTESTLPHSFIVESTIISRMRNLWLQKDISINTDNPWVQAEYPDWQDGHDVSYEDVKTVRYVGSDVRASYPDGCLIRLLSSAGRKAFSTVGSTSLDGADTLIEFNNEIVVNYASLHTEICIDGDFVEQRGTTKTAL